MYMKLYPVNEPTQVTFYMDSDPELRSLLEQVTSSTQDKFCTEAWNLFQFADRLGLDGTKLVTELKLRNTERRMTIQCVPYNQYRIFYRDGGFVGFERFNGTEKDLKKELRAMRMAGQKPIRTEIEIELSRGYKFGSIKEDRTRPFTFGTVWGDRVEGKPHLITRMLKTLAQHERALSTAKDDLLEQVARKLEPSVA